MIELYTDDDITHSGLASTSASCLPTAAAIRKEDDILQRIIAICNGKDTVKVLYKNIDATDKRLVSVDEELIIGEGSIYYEYNERV